MNYRNWGRMSNEAIANDLIGMASRTSGNTVYLPLEAYEFVSLTPFNINDCRAIVAVARQNSGKSFELGS